MSLLDELGAYEASLSGKDLKVFKKAYEESRERFGGRESLATGKLAVEAARTVK